MSARATAPRATVRLLARCTNACVFCGQHGGDTLEPLAPDAIESALARARAGGAAEVTLVGGEPTLHPGLADAIARARALGFARVGLQTHARRLGEPGYAAQLAAAGLTDVHVSLHGASAAVHDYHTGEAGSLAQSLAGVAAARARGVAVVALTVLTRSNFRSLAPELPRLLAARGVAAWMLEVPHAAGRAAGAFDRVVPRLGLALPFALHALEAARGIGLAAAWIRGAPACLLGPLATRAAPSAPRAYGAPCAGCPAREAGCPGVDSLYLARFGGDELAPRAAAVASAVKAPTRTPADEALVRMFVGPGELAAGEAKAHEVAPPPARARVSLPLLGKVQPARGEVPAGSPKQSGEALRAIFPELFGESAEGGGEKG